MQPKTRKFGRKSNLCTKSSLQQNAPVATWTRVAVAGAVLVYHDVLCFYSRR